MIIDSQALRLAKLVTRHIIPHTLGVSAKVDEDANCLRLRALRLHPDETINITIPGDALRACETLGDFQRQVTDGAKEAVFRAKLATVLAGP